MKYLSLESVAAEMEFRSMKYESLSLVWGPMRPSLLFWYYNTKIPRLEWHSNLWFTKWITKIHDNERRRCSSSPWSTATASAEAELISSWWWWWRWLQYRRHTIHLCWNERTIYWKLRRPWRSPRARRFYTTNRYRRGSSARQRRYDNINDEKSSPSNKAKEIPVHYSFSSTSHINTGVVWSLIFHKGYK